MGSPGEPDVSAQDDGGSNSVQEQQQQLDLNSAPSEHSTSPSRVAAAASSSVAPSSSAMEHESSAAAADALDEPDLGGYDDVLHLDEGQANDEAEREDYVSNDVVLSDPESGHHEGKRVKVYELRDNSWFDRGTGFCKGVYDDSQDIALMIVEAEADATAGKVGDDEGEGGGGFLKEDLLLTARIEPKDIYQRQQDTLIVWTEPASRVDYALSFQDAEGCEDIWGFIKEVQRHLNLLPQDGDGDPSGIPSGSSPPHSPSFDADHLLPAMTVWEPPTLANIKQQETWLRMQAKSAPGRERAVEHIVNEGYIKQLLNVFEQAEDLELLEDLHALCSLVQTILMVNDNTLLEYILQDDIFEGVIGIFEYDPDFPLHKAYYRQFYQQTARYREVVDIKDEAIRIKIHQLFRVQFLRDVVLARMLDDGTFGILNGYVFYTQTDIITYIQNNNELLHEIMDDFQGAAKGPPDHAEPLNERKRDLVLLLNQLMILAKGIQVPNRIGLYRTLIERGLLFVIEWSLRRPEAQILHAGAEMLTLAVEHDVNSVRQHVIKEDEAKSRSLIVEMVDLLNSTKNMGLLSQIGDALRTMLETASDDSFMARKDGTLSETFISSFYDNTVELVYKPLQDLPEIQKGKAPTIPREKRAMLHTLIETLSSAVGNTSQHHRASYYILSNPISRKIVSLLYVKDKPLRHASLRFVRACLRIQNHFIFRYFVKNDLLIPLLDLLEQESTRDNILCSASIEILEIVRKNNIKAIINYLFDEYRPRLDVLGQRPYLRRLIEGLHTRWQQNNEPPPPTHPPESSTKAWTRAVQAAEEEDYFNVSDDEDESSRPIIYTATPSGLVPNKRKRATRQAPPSSPRERPRARPAAPSPGKMMSGGRARAASGGLVDYDDGSDSDGSDAQGQSPRLKPGDAGGSNIELKSTEELEDDLGEVQMKMRAKRMKEDEEEEGFATLFGGAKKGKDTKDKDGKDKGGPVQGAAPAGDAEESKKDKGREREKDNGKEGTDGKKEEGGKKIRLSFGSLKRLGSGGK